MKILIAIDDSEFSRSAVEFCGSLFGANQDAVIKILTSFERMIPPTEPFSVSDQYVRAVDSQSRAKANETAAKAKDLLCEKYSSLADKISIDVVSGSPARTIVEEAENWKADLIVTGSHGYGFWKRALLGSVSNAVAHHVPCSVLIVRDPDHLADQSASES
ncbi:MAG: universal stress protein [Acidobacteria bacterium]|nr:universal stress protein [Acidobacteriota bacterium]